MINIRKFSNELPKNGEVIWYYFEPFDYWTVGTFYSDICISSIIGRGFCDTNDAPYWIAFDDFTPDLLTEDNLTFGWEEIVQRISRYPINDRDSFIGYIKSKNIFIRDSSGTVHMGYAEAVADDTNVSFFYLGPDRYQINNPKEWRRIPENFNQ